MVFREYTIISHNKDHYPSLSHIEFNLHPKNEIEKRNEIGEFENFCLSWCLKGFLLTRVGDESRGTYLGLRSELDGLHVFRAHKSQGTHTNLATKKKKKKASTQTHT